ncbi:MAG: DNA primase [Bacteroidales bacterium]|nr:DNA primase [Bacteroidales bacterium]
MIDRETIQRILDASHIEEVVGDFVSLKKRGSNHIGCCPFHNEKTPSFYVSPSKGIYKCFGCGEAGDVVKFLMKHEHYAYPEALRWLADKYHIEIKEKELTPEEKERQTERDGLFHVSEFAQRYFASLLYEDETGRAVGLAYFHERGLTDDIIRRFGLGYCLDEWDSFTAHARKQGYSDAVLEKTGLTIFKDENGKQRIYDRFRGRVMFPIYSVSGRVLGFSGRVLSSGKQAAKYVNSPDSDIYNKSRILYGLFQARQAIAKADKCYLVEGNIDVLSMHQSGVENTVASCGTSLTVEQIRLIHRYTPNVTVVYDGDSAGIKAALRAVDLLFAEGMHVRLVLFPDGEDPDSYAQKYGSTQLQDYLASHEDNFILFKTRVLIDDAKNDPIKKASLVSDTAHSIALVSDLLERSEYIRQCSQLLRVSEDVLYAAVGKAIAQGMQKQQQSEGAPQQPSVAPPEIPTEEPQPTQSIPSAAPSLIPPPPTELHLVRLLLNYGNHQLHQFVPPTGDQPQELTVSVAEAIINELRAENLSFTHPYCQRILEQCSLMLDLQGVITPARITDTDDATFRTFVITLMVDDNPIWRESWEKKGVFTPTIEDNLLKDVVESINHFKQVYIAQHIDNLREEIRNAPSDQQAPLLMQLQQYKQIEIQLSSSLGYVISPKHH